MVAPAGSSPRLVGQRRMVTVVDVERQSMSWDHDDSLEQGPAGDDLNGDSTDLLPCPACGAAIYEDSERCPRCGRWVIPLAGHARRRGTIWWVGAGLALLGMLAWAMS